MPSDYDYDLRLVELSAAEAKARQFRTLTTELIEVCKRLREANIDLRSSALTARDYVREDLEADPLEAAEAQDAIRVGDLAATNAVRCIEKAEAALKEN